MKKKPVKIILVAAEVIAIVLLVALNLGIKNVVKDEGVHAKGDSGPSLDFVNIPTFGFDSLIDVVLVPTKTPSYTKAMEGQEKQKDVYLIAAIGDSMVDTMGGGLDYLAVTMREKYPDKTMVFYNYGIGSENLEGALTRFDSQYTYFDRSHETLAQLSPDILIVGSYSYNPPFPFNESKQTEDLTRLLQKAKSVSPDVYLLVEIAPLQYGFGDGPGGVNWEPATANAHSANIVSLLRKSIDTGEVNGVTVINVYEESLVEESGFGQNIYVSSHDSIHPSIEGQELVAKVATEAIELP